MAVLINPNGIALWRLPFYTVPVSLRIYEWLSPDFHRIDFHPILWLLFLWTVGLARSRERPDLSSLFKVLGFACMAFVSVRAVAVCAPVTAPPTARLLAGALNPSLADRLQEKGALPSALRRLLNGSILLALTAAVLTRAVILSSSAWVEQSYPAAAVAWFRERRPEGRFFNSYNWGAISSGRSPNIRSSWTAASTSMGMSSSPNGGRWWMRRKLDGRFWTAGTSA